MPKQSNQTCPCGPNTCCGAHCSSCGQLICSVWQQQKPPSSCPPYTHCHFSSLHPVLDFIFSPNTKVVSWDFYLESVALLNPSVQIFYGPCQLYFGGPSQICSKTQPSPDHFVDPVGYLILLNIGLQKMLLWFLWCSPINISLVVSHEPTWPV